MNFAEKIFMRATVRGVADYLLYGMIPNRDDRSYETRLDDADLAYEKVAKQYDEDGASVLLSAANELANENASVYMELGLQAGILLITDLFQNICRGKKQAGISMVSHNCKTQETQNQDSNAGLSMNSDIDPEPDTNMHSEIRHTVLQQFIRDRLDTALEDTLRKDRQYQKSKQNAEVKAGRLSKDKFTPEQWELIDDALEENNASASKYGRVAYQQGFFDALDIFKGIRSMKEESK